MTKVNAQVCCIVIRMVFLNSTGPGRRQIVDYQKTEAYIEPRPLPSSSQAKRSQSTWKYTAQVVQSQSPNKRHWARP